ncbi:5280_t:CDS:2 [Entrophospora sp. SA101]|nr:5280_t:CDS:2 [Entrophospora sp. SA101]
MSTMLSNIAINSSSNHSSNNIIITSSNNAENNNNNNNNSNSINNNVVVVSDSSINESVTVVINNEDVMIISKNNDNEYNQNESVAADTTTVTVTATVESVATTDSNISGEDNQIANNGGGDDDHDINNDSNTNININYKEENEKLLTEIANLRGEIDLLKHDSQQRKDDSTMINMLNVCLGNSNKNINGLIKDLSAAKKETHHMISQLNIVKNQNIILESDCAKLKQEKLQSEASRKMLISENNKFKDDNDRLNHDIKILQNYKNTSDFNLELLDNINDELTKSNIQLDSQCSIYECMIERLEDISNHQTYEIRKLKEEIDNHKCCKEKMSEQEYQSPSKDSLTETISELKEVICSKNKTIEKYILRSDNQEHEIARLKCLYAEKVGRLNLELSKEQKTSETFVNKVNRFIEIIRAQMKENEDLKNLREKDQREKKDFIL